MFLSKVAGFRNASFSADVCVVGGGPGGYVAAIKAAQHGQKVICVEKSSTLGGTCLNVGCIPSKCLLHSSHLYAEATSKFHKFGVMTPNASFDMQKVMEFKNNTVSELTKGIEHLFAKNKIKSIVGTGSFVKPNMIKVSYSNKEKESDFVTAKNIIIATGSEVSSPPFIQIDEERVVSSSGALSFKTPPKNLAVIGAGVIGLELGSVWQRFGSNVHYVEFGPHILPFTEPQIRTQMALMLKRQKGTQLLLNTKVTDLKKGDKITLTMSPSNGKGEETKREFDAVLVSVGRKPATKNIGLENIGISVDRLGRIPVNEDCSLPQHSHIYAIGDCIHGPMLAHKASEEGYFVASKIANPNHSSSLKIRHDLVPSVVYTSPEVAWVGLTREQAEKQGLQAKVVSIPLKVIGRAKCIGQQEGVVCMVTDKNTRRILGVHLMCDNAGELIHECVLALGRELTADNLAETCHAHPTLSEAIHEAALASVSNPIHM